MDNLVMTTSTCLDPVLTLGSHNDTTGSSSTSSSILDNETLRKSMDVYGYLQQHPTGTMLPKLLRRYHNQQQQQQKEKQNQRQISSIENDDDEDDVHVNDIGGGGEYLTIKEDDDDTFDDEDDEDYDGNDMSRSERNRYRQIYNNNKSKYWNCNEIIDSINATSRQILNIQQQIRNGEDYYINHNASISIYNIYNKNNNYDTTIFLDSKSDTTMNTNMNTNSSGVGNTATSLGNNAFNTTSSNSANNNNNSNNQYRWFSNSFTNVKRYQKKLAYNPTIIVPIKRYMNHQQQHYTNTTNIVDDIKVDLSSQPISVVQSIENFDNDTGSTLPIDTIEITTGAATTTTGTKRRNNDTLRSSQQQQQQQQPARRTTKRRRKTTS